MSIVTCPKRYLRFTKFEKSDLLGIRQLKGFIKNFDSARVSIPNCSNNSWNTNVSMLCNIVSFGYSEHYNEVYTVLPKQLYVRDMNKHKRSMLLK